MLDVQNTHSETVIDIDRVGVKNISVPLSLKEQDGGSQHSVARLELCVDLPFRFKGTHMSRFVEAINDWDKHLHYDSVKLLLQELKKRLHSERSYVHLDFSFFQNKPSPVSHNAAIQGYDCSFDGELDQKGCYRAFLSVKVPVMTVCPCSKAISVEGAHSQRAMVSMKIRHKNFVGIEELVRIAETSASSQVYPLLKREDEKFVTENSFANPCFVEDVVRNVAEKLDAHPCCAWYHVEVESFESIHSHNAFASIERERAEDAAKI